MDTIPPQPEGRERGAGSVGPCVLGIDAGTQGLRAGIYDLQGRPLAYATRAYPATYPSPGWAEQEPGDWWQAMVEAVRECVARSGVPAREIVAMGLDHTSCTVVAVDAKGAPLRPALLWMDVRAHQQAERITAAAHPTLRYAGGIASAEWMVPKVLWLKEREPQIYQRAHRIAEGLDWLTYRLTGRWVASRNNATCRWHYVGHEGGWPRDLLRQLDLEDLLGKWPSEALALGEPIGPLLPAVAAELGLAAGTPLVQGGIDAYTGMIGLDVLRPGRLALIVGSSTCHLAMGQAPAFGSRLWGPFPDAVLPGLWVLEGGQVSTGSIVRWLAEELGASAPANAPESADTYAWLDQQASAAGVGAEGLVLLDHWQGNRLPLRDPLARGAIWGLSLKHGVGHLLRAVYEGTAYGTRQILAEMAGAGLRTQEMVACGGGTRSALWMQICADVCQVPIALTTVQEATGLGAAICAAVGAGAYGSLPQAAQHMVRITRRIEPRAELAEAYSFYYGHYLATYERLKDMMHAVARRVELGH